MGEMEGGVPMVKMQVDIHQERVEGMVGMEGMGEMEGMEVMEGMEGILL